MGEMDEKAKYGDELGKEWLRTFDELEIKNLHQSGLKKISASNDLITTNTVIIELTTPSSVH
jgi:hypothetical protein